MRAARAAYPLSWCETTSRTGCAADAHGPSAYACRKASAFANSRFACRSSSLRRTGKGAKRRVSATVVPRWFAVSVCCGADRLVGPYLPRDAPGAARERSGPVELQNRADGGRLGGSGEDADGLAERTEGGEGLAAKAECQDCREVVKAGELGGVMFQCCVNRSEREQHGESTRDTPTLL
jgi:hypothetical protein